MDSSEDMTDTKRQRQREHAKRSYYKRVVRVRHCSTRRFMRVKRLSRDLYVCVLYA